MKNLKYQFAFNLRNGLNIFIYGCLFTLCLSCAQEPSVKWVEDPAAFVNPFIGTEGERAITDAANTVPGAVMPFGMLSFGPETTFSNDMSEHRRYKMIQERDLRMPVSPGGYNYAASRVRGFSLTRLSGTGCVGASGDIPFLPFTAEITHSPDNDPLDGYYSAGFGHEDEQAKPGYYQVKLTNGVNVELTATDRSGIAEFEYPAEKPARLLVRTSYSQLGSGDAFTEIDVENGEVSGHVVSGNFCGYLGAYNQRDYYTLYFVAKFSNTIIETGAWKDGEVLKGATEAAGGMPYSDNGFPVNGKGSGVWIGFDTSTNKKVTMQVGISYVSVENARLNLAKEQAASDDFESVKERAYQAWNASLGKIKVESTDRDQLTTFYTALYHSQFHPNIFSDVNGEYAGFDGNTHRIEASQTAQYANFSGWDVYRSQLQLLTMLHPTRGNDIAQTLLNQANQYNGVWDRWTHNNGPTGVMSGDPSTIAIANFVAFGSDQFNVKQAYASLAKAAKVPTEFDLSGVGAPVFARGQKPSLDQWLSLNYIANTSNSWEGASETLEQSSAYFALAQLANRLDKKEDYNLFLEQSGYWENLFNPKATDSLGYIQAKNVDGTWTKGFDPYNMSLFVEGSPLQYLWMVPFDGKGLVERMGGPEKAAKRMDDFFHKKDGTWALYREGGFYSDVSNQPSINAPWMYLFTGKAYKTQETLRAAMSKLWRPTTTGIPGQDDLGQMSSWYVFSALGMYPLYPGRADMVLGSPVFSRSKIVRASGDIEIISENNSKEAVFVKSLSINGKTTQTPWVSESFMKNGGVLEFKMSDSIHAEFGGLENMPPSYRLK